MSRNAYLYVRQSTLRQVHENTESTKRQYGLKQKAISIGWSIESIVTIDTDLGQSGAAFIERSGFQRLAAEVGMGRAGIVIGLEVSRLSRSSSEWGRLLEICSITDTLIMDEDGIYDTNDFNDRLLLGLKGTMSEAELHFLQARMRGGLLNKAKRGELKHPIPVGYIYNDNDQIVFDPDIQVQQSIRLFFETFRRVGSAWGTVKEFNKQGFKFPLRVHRGFRKGELHWVQLVNSRTLQILHNPCYAGVHAYGKTQIQRTVNGKKSVAMPREEWHTFIPDSHPGYITLEEYERNLKILEGNTHPRSEDGRKTPPREGPALLQGVVVCGICGKRMTVRYQNNSKRLVPIYVCQKRSVEYGEKICQSINGANIDEAISAILLEMVNPLAMEAALEVEKELNSRKDEISKCHMHQVERARYEMELARRRYMGVDPDNRLVASQLEHEWNSKLKEFEEAQESYEKQLQSQVKAIDEKVRSDIRELAIQFPKVWNDKSVPDREKKRMLRCLVEDVTISQGQDIMLSIRFKGGTSRIINVTRPEKCCEKWTTHPEVMAEIDRLTAEHTTSEIVEILSKKGIKSGQGKNFTNKIIDRLIREHDIKNLYTRLREDGYLTLPEKMKEMGCSQKEIQKLRETDKINCRKYCDRDEFLYEPCK